MPNAPTAAMSLDHFIGYAGIALDQRAVHRGLAEFPQPSAELLAAAAGFLTRARMRMDQVQPEVTQEQLLTKARLIPPGLPGFLRYLTCLALADPSATFCLLRAHGLPYVQ